MCKDKPYCPSDWELDATCFPIQKQRGINLSDELTTLTVALTQPQGFCSAV